MEKSEIMERLESLVLANIQDDDFRKSIYEQFWDSVSATVVPEEEPGPITAYLDTCVTALIEQIEACLEGVVTSNHAVNCRNFACPTSDGKGGCRSARLEFTPVGGVIDKLICIPCTRNAEPVKREPPIDPARTGNEHHDVA